MDSLFKPMIKLNILEEYKVLLHGIGLAICEENHTSSMLGAYLQTKCFKYLYSKLKFFFLFKIFKTLYVILLCVFFGY